MAFAPPVSGINGAFYLADSGGTPAEIAHIRSWSIDITANEVDVSAFSGNGWAESVGSLKKWTATVEGQWSYSDTSGCDLLWTQFGDEVEVRFYVDDGNAKYFSGSAIVVGITPSTAVDAAATFSATLSGVGALSYTT
ncbi:MAG: phage tail tube protein [Dehalococcoidia bacterium]|jgi:predicted secreted protein|nr:phage tail tube protein [Dehalococcoidia bacterium]